MISDNTRFESRTDFVTFLFGQRVGHLIGRDVIKCNLFTLTHERLLDRIDVLTIARALEEVQECTEAGGVAFTLIASVLLYLYAIDAGRDEDARDGFATLCEREV